MITITNDSDLFIAIGSIKNDVKKLYIKLDEDNVEIPIGKINFYRKFNKSQILTAK